MSFRTVQMSSIWLPCSQVPRPGLYLWSSMPSLEALHPGCNSHGFSLWLSLSVKFITCFPFVLSFLVALTVSICENYNCSLYVCFYHLHLASISLTECFSCCHVNQLCVVHVAGIWSQVTWFFRGSRRVEPVYHSKNQSTHTVLEWLLFLLHFPESSFPPVWLKILQELFIPY